MKRLIAILSAGLCLCGANLIAQINYEHSTRLKDGWQFLRQDVGNLWETLRPVNGPEAAPRWLRVSLPHCFNEEDGVDPGVNYYQGPGWYKNTIEVNNPYEQGRTLLHFEGAGQKTEVYVNGEKVGDHIGGYDEWTVDITDAVERFRKSASAGRYKGRVPVAIRCDNSRDAEMMPSDLSDFNLYGGIYRHLNLVYTPALAVSGIQIDASVDPAGREGRVTVGVDIKDAAQVGEYTLSVKITAPGDASSLDLIPIKSGGKVTGYQGTLNRPVLWSPDSPALYTCEVVLKSDAGDMVCRERFGFRHIEFVEKGPFKLNGQRLLLRGTHRHEDHARVAAAMDDDMIIREMEMIKAMGANFIRLGHYQQSRIVLDQCDRLGLLVWEEIPWCRGGVGGERYREQGRRMLANMIAQHRNHPSVILWGLGNENDWPGDFPVFKRDGIRGYMQELHDLAKRLDPSRPTCIRRCDFCKDIVDVYSPSIWAGWYSNLYTDYQRMSRTNQERVKRFLHVEWGGDSQAGRHADYAYDGLDSPAFTDDPGKVWRDMASQTKKARDNSETYICDLIDWHLKEQEGMGWLTGAAYWPFKDFSTPIRFDGPVPYMNQKGVVARDLTPKESYYVFQSYWSSKPMVHVYGHTWPERYGEPGEEKWCKVYSNCDEVELFLNGRSLGKKKRDSRDFPAAGLRWKTAFREGGNELEAVSVSGDTQVRDRISFRYTTAKPGREHAIKLTVVGDGDDHAWIEACLVDDRGNVCLNSRRVIEFGSAGDGRLIVNQGTPWGSSRVEACNGRARVRLSRNNGRTVVTAKCKGLETAVVEVK